MNLEAEFLKQSRAFFMYYRTLGDKAIATLTDEQLFICPSTESNSVAIIIKHLSGNMKARWTDVFTTDGEKTNRNRDEEFTVENNTAKEIRTLWNVGWNTLFTALNSFGENDLEKTITIRQEQLSVMKALIRQMTHYSYHVGQIVYIAKMINNESWVSLSIPKGESSKYIDTPPKSV